jgi:hypothetical protein
MKSAAFPECDLLNPCTAAEDLGKAEPTFDYSFKFGRLGNLKRRR